MIRRCLIAFLLYIYFPKSQFPVNPLKIQGWTRLRFRSDHDRDHGI